MWAFNKLPEEKVSPIMLEKRVDELSTRLTHVEQDTTKMQNTIDNIQRRQELLGDTINEMHKAVLSAPRQEELTRGFDRIHQDFKTLDTKVSNIKEVQAVRNGREQVISTLLKWALGILGTLVTAYIIYQVGIG